MTLFLAQTISMETLVGSSSKTLTSFLPPSFKNPSGYSSNLLFRNGHVSFGPMSSEKVLSRSRRRSLMMVDAKKKSKVDSHSFTPKPDEATGPFPEAVLLKEKKVQEDGRALPEFADEEEEELFEYLNLQLESDLDADQMRHYEVIYLIHQDHKDKVDDVNSKIKVFLREKKGSIWRFSDWGMRRLAYKIKKATHAHYILMNFELGSQWINEFKQMLDQDERVIRHLVIKRDKAITEDCPAPPEFHTLRADMVDEYEVDDEDDDEDYADDDGEELDNEDEQDLKGYEDDEVDVESSVRSINVVKGTSNQKSLAKGKETSKREKVLR